MAGLPVNRALCGRPCVSQSWCKPTDRNRLSGSGTTSSETPSVFGRFHASDERSWSMTRIASHATLQCCVCAVRLAELDDVPIRIDDHEIAHTLPRLFGRRTLRRYSCIAQLLIQPVEIGRFYLHMCWPAKPLA